MKPAGFSVIEALVATLVAGLALAGLTTVAGTSSRALRVARDETVAVAMAAERLEALRAGPRPAGTDTIADANGTRFARRWSATGGRGRPARIDCRVAWGAHAVIATSEAPP